MAILDEFGNPNSFRTFAHSADTSTRRGPQFAVRNDDIDRLIPATDRKNLMSLANRLVWNVGMLSAVIAQKADWTVGEAWLPSYLGPDADNGKIVSKFIRVLWFPPLPFFSVRFTDTISPHREAAYPSHPGIGLSSKSSMDLSVIGR